MAKFKQSNLEMMDGQKLILDTTKAKYISYDGVETFINTTLSGVTPTNSGHLTTKSYVDTISGSLQTNIDGKSELNHLHIESDITDLDKYTQLEVDSKWPTWSGTIDHNTIQNTHNLTTDIDHNNLTNYLVDEHRIINDGETASTDLWSASKISSEIASASGITDHSDLNNLDYVSAGHTGFSPDTHLHDDRYYTESEVDTISGTLSTEIDNDISTHASNTDAHHNESHTITSHSDITDATGANLEELTGGGDTTLHDHDGISENTAARHAESHTVASHSDTTATGAELEELTDGSETSLHIHDGRYYTESEVDDLITASSGTTDHSALDNLDYASAGHTGFSPTSHFHVETDISDLDRYTQAEVDTISGSLSTEIDSDISTHASNTDAHHAESHTVASHSDTTATGAELEELTDGSETSLHIHDGRYYTESEVDDLITASSGTTDHSALDNLDYASAGHTGFSPDTHLHDDRYYTETELDAGQLDDRYYTESEVDTISGSLQTQIDDITVSGGVNTFVDLNDTPATYSGNEDKHVYVESDGNGLNFRYINDDDNYTEITYDGVFPTQINVYTNSGKTHQTSSTVITRVSGVVSQTTKSIYDIDTGTSVVGTFTTTINRDNGRVVSTTSVRT